jgi:hypothetical protein
MPPLLKHSSLNNTPGKLTQALNGPSTFESQPECFCPFVQVYHSIAGTDAMGSPREADSSSASQEFPAF